MKKLKKKWFSNELDDLYNNKVINKSTYDSIHNHYGHQGIKSVVPMSDILAAGAIIILLLTAIFTLIITKWNLISPSTQGIISFTPMIVGIMFSILAIKYNHINKNLIDFSGLIYILLTGVHIILSEQVFNSGLDSIGLMIIWSFIATSIILATKSISGFSICAVLLILSTIQNTHENIYELQVSMFCIAICIYTYLKTNSTKKTQHFLNWIFYILTTVYLVKLTPSQYYDALIIVLPLFFYWFHIKNRDFNTTKTSSDTFMQTHQYVKYALLIIPLAYPISTTYLSLDLHNKGKEVKLEVSNNTLGVHLTGKYLTLDLTTEIIPAELAPWVTTDDYLYITFNDNKDDNFSTIKSISKNKPAHNDYIKSTVSSRTLDNIYLEYPFFKFYIQANHINMPVYKFKELIRKSSSKSSYATVSIKNGIGSIKNIHINGNSILELIKQ